MFEIVFETTDTLDQRREQIQSLLTENVCAVTFTKVDGELRIMPCTLRPDLLPRVEKAMAVERPRNPENMSVWCVDQQGWRSFRLANVTTVRVLEGK